MDISNVTQSYINKRVENAKKYMSEEDKKECSIGLGNADQNGDGKTTGIDMYKSWSNTCARVFEGNETFLARGEEIAQQQGELYALYAGEDGVLDEYEYEAALQSEEMGALIDEYWEMRNIMDAENGTLQESQLERNDANFDNNITAIDIYKSKENLYNKKFNDDAIKRSQAQDIAQRQAEILSRFEGEDGKLSAKEFAQAVQTEEYKKTIEDFYNLY